MTEQSRTCNTLSKKQGSALLLTLLVVSLLLVITLAFVAKVRVELRRVQNHQQRVEARSVAKLALQLGVAQLQERVGVDQRITTTSGRVDGMAHDSWSGVYSSIDLSEPVWLVSGESPDPSAVLPEETSVRLRTGRSSPVPLPEVRVPLLHLDHPELNAVIGWWTADEGVKARIDLVPETPPPATVGERHRLAQTAQSPGLGVLGGDWPLVSDSIERWKLMRLNDTRLLTDGFDSAAYDEDLTTEGYGLPVNVVDGGLKADLSVVMDRSMEGHPALEYTMGARPTLSPPSGSGFRPPDYKANVWDFPTAAISDPDTFYLSDRYGTVTNPAGPNMGILWHYGRLWQEVSTGHASPLVGIHPRVEAPLWEENWLPYRQLDSGMFNNDLQHTNSPVMPILSHLQMSFRLRSRFEGVDPDTGERNYLLQLEIKPLVGLWNPYNVGIEEDTYVIDTMMPPMVKVRMRRPGATEDEDTTSWLRLIWSHGDHPLHTEANPGGRYFKLNIRDQDFQPGEVRLFSTDSVIQIMSNLDNARMRDQINLIPGWNSSGAYVVNLQTTTTQTGFEQELIRVPEGTQIWFHDVYFQDSHHPDAQAWFNNPSTPSTQRIHPDSSMSWLTLKARGGTGIFMSRYIGMWNSGTIRESAGGSQVTVPERIKGSSANRVPRLVESLTSGNHHIGTWAFHLRTSTQMEEPNQRIRGWVDADPRALIGSSHWDGARDFDSEDGWNFMGALMGGSLNVPSISDGEGGNRGLVAVGGFGNPAPQSDGSSRYRGYIGGANTPVGGSTHVPLFDVPTSPLVSIGQFQHAQLGRYSYEPGYVLGNSYANVRIPLDRTHAVDFNSISGFRLEDISYHVNQRVWDRYFFSTLAPDYVGGGSSFDLAFSGRLDRLPNPRMVYDPAADGRTLDQLITDRGERAAEAISGRVKIKGAFNVNSTSRRAWKAVLASMLRNELPVLNPQTGEMSWEQPDRIRFNRFSHVLSAAPYASGSLDDAAFWQGWREVTGDQLDELAGEIVREVRARGPFRSMAEFVNRDPNSAVTEHRRKGALQAALDRTLNRQGTDIPELLGGRAQKPIGTHFSDAIDGESEAAGAPGYLLQGDILQTLAPILQVRSDTFRIRAFAQVASDGTPQLPLVCEAVVQRIPEYVDPQNNPHENDREDILSAVNQRFGRRFRIVSFRWLDPSEI